MGFQAGAVPWTAMVTWCEFHGLERDNALAVINVIRRLDADQAKAAAAKAAADKATGAGRKDR